MTIWYTLAMVSFLVMLAPPLALGDIEAIRAEPRLEKRSEKALKNADLMVNVARDAYLKGERENLKAALREVRESVELCHESLKATGKDPRRNSKYYKRAEIGTRKLQKRLQSFRDEMSFEDRDLVEDTVQHVQKVHGDLLHAIMGGAK